MRASCSCLLRVRLSPTRLMLQYFIFGLSHLILLLVVVVFVVCYINDWGNAVECVKSTSYKDIPAFVFLVIFYEMLTGFYMLLAPEVEDIRRSW